MLFLRLTLLAAYVVLDLQLGIVDGTLRLLDEIEGDKEVPLWMRSPSERSSA